MGADLLGISALLLMAAVSTVWFRAAMRVQLPRNRSAFVAGSLGAAALGVFSLLQGAGWLGGVAAGLAVAAGGLFTLLVGISRQQVAPDAVVPGGQLPDFSAPDENGEIFELSNTRGTPVLLKFFRGHW